jgi:hypothetical protein
MKKVLVVLLVVGLLIGICGVGADTIEEGECVDVAGEPKDSNPSPCGGGTGDSGGAPGHG